MKTSGGLRRRLIVGARGHLIVTLILLGASFAAQVGIARRFSLLGLGEYVATTLVVFLASVTAISGLPLAMGDMVARYHEKGDEPAERDVASTGFVLAMTLSLVAAMLAGLAWPMLADILGLRRPVPAALIAAAVFAAGSLGYVPLIFQARLEMAAMGIIAIVQPLVVVAALGWDTVAPGVRPSTMAVLGYVAAGTVAAGGFFVAGYRPSLVREQISPLVKQAARSLPIVYSNIFSAWADRLLVSLLLGPAALGIYQAAAALIDGAGRIPRAASPFLVSAYARVSVDHSAQLERVVRLHTHLWLAYAAVLAAGLIAGADGLATSIFGFGSIAVADPLRILALALMPNVLALSLATAVTGQRAGNAALVIGLVTIPLQVALMILMAPLLGIAGAALAHVLVALVAFGSYWLWSRHGLLARENPLGPALLVGALAVGSAAVTAALPVPWLVRSITAALVASALVGVALFGREERRMIRVLFARD